jgi:hypothetical protein
MPASFKVRSVPLDETKNEEVLDPDFGESAIGRVAPVDSGLWWIILLRAYGKITGDYTVQERVDVLTSVKLIMNLCLSDGFDMFPSLLVTDGSCIIDRRMGIHGHPVEIQSLVLLQWRILAYTVMAVHSSMHQNGKNRSSKKSYQFSREKTGSRSLARILRYQKWKLHWKTI